MTSRPGEVLPLADASEGTISRGFGLARSLPELVHGSTLVCVSVAMCLYMVYTWRWRMAVDTPVMHYVVYLMRHGLSPYGDITDNNMPGTYMTEALAMAVFGGSDLAWRVYESCVMAVYLYCAAFLTRVWHWSSGLFGAGIFLVMHAAEGPQLAVEREMLIGVLTAVACVLLFQALDRHRPILLLGAGLLSGVAASIKPTYVLLTCALVVIAAYRLQQKKMMVHAYVLWGCIGLLLAFCADLFFLVFFHSLHGFAFILTDVLPAYHDIASMHWYVMIFASMPAFVALLTFVAVPLIRINGRPARSSFALQSCIEETTPHRNWHWWTLAVVAVFGLISFFAQGKGYLYHRYVFLMFLLPLLGVELFTGMETAGWPRLVSLLSICFVLGYVFPSRLAQTRAIVGSSAFELTLEGDLQRLAKTSDLNGKVQCFDMVYGCLDALYHLDLVENSGFTGDMLLFPPAPNSASRYYQAKFWELAKRNPAEVLVIGNGLIGETNRSDKLDRWPEFRAYLKAHYELALECRFLHDRYGYESRSKVFQLLDADTYDIYVRKP